MSFYYSGGVHITQQARICGQILPILCQISAKKNCEIWLKIDEIWPNSASPKIPGLLSYTYPTVSNMLFTIAHIFIFTAVSLKSNFPKTVSISERGRDKTSRAWRGHPKYDIRCYWTASSTTSLGPTCRMWKNWNKSTLTKPITAPPGRNIYRKKFAKNPNFGKKMKFSSKTWSIYSAVCNF